MSDNPTIAELRETLKNTKQLPNFPGKADHIKWLKSKIAAEIASAKHTEAAAIVGAKQ
jgi:hypothetical protein